MHCRVLHSSKPTANANTFKRSRRLSAPGCFSAMQQHFETEPAKSIQGVPTWPEGGIKRYAPASSWCIRRMLVNYKRSPTNLASRLTSGYKLCSDNLQGISFFGVFLLFLQFISVQLRGVKRDAEHQDRDCSQERTERLSHLHDRIPKNERFWTSLFSFYGHSL